MPLDESVRRETRCIRDIQAVHADLLPLDSSGNKIPGTTLDAFAAFLHNSDDPDWCIFYVFRGLRTFITVIHVNRTPLLRMASTNPTIS